MKTDLSQSAESESVTQSCPTLCIPMDCSLPGSSVRGILQARIVEWVAIPFSRESSQPRNRTHISCTAGRFFTPEPRGSPYQYLESNKFIETKQNGGYQGPRGKGIKSHCLRNTEFQFGIMKNFWRWIAVKSIYSHIVTVLNATILYT